MVRLVQWWWWCGGVLRVKKQGFLRILLRFSDCLAFDAHAYASTQQVQGLYKGLLVTCSLCFVYVVWVRSMLGVVWSRVFWSSRQQGGMR